MISMGYMTSSLFGSTCPRPQAPLCLLPLNASILRLPSTPLHAPPPSGCAPLVLCPESWPDRQPLLPTQEVSPCADPAAPRRLQSSSVGSPFGPPRCCEGS